MPDRIFVLVDGVSVECVPKSELSLDERLATSGHWSPFEHVAMAYPGEERHPECGNFAHGWRQYRKGFAKEFTP